MESNENTLSSGVESSLSSPVESTESASIENAPVENTSTGSMSTESVASPVTSLTNETVSEPTNEVESIAKSPASKGRTSGQKKGDEGSAEVLKRMQNLYETEFADVPANKRPKAKAWAARAAYYKPTEEAREAYIQQMIQNDRNSIMSKNSGEHNAGLGNNSDSLMNQLMTALDTATRVARQIKNTTKKNGKRSIMKSMNLNSNGNMNGSVNMDDNVPMNSYNNNSTFKRSKRVSPLPSKKTKKANKSLYNAPSPSYGNTPLEF